MRNTPLLLVSLLAILSITTPAQEMTARAYAAAHSWKSGGSRQVTLDLPHACTLSKQHPCIYYGGDFNVSDPEQNGLSNENTLLIPQSYTYTEVKVPVSVHITASFSNNLGQYGVLDPMTATWAYRTGVSEGQGGSLICSGETPAQIRETLGNPLFPEWEVLTRTPCTVPAGNVWAAVLPDCTNANDDDCNLARYFESDTDGLNAINGQFTVTSNTGMGPTLDSEPSFGYVFASWCNDLQVACGDGMSFGILK